MCEKKNDGGSGKTEMNSVRKCDECLPCKLNCLYCFISVIVITIGLVLFVDILCGGIPTETKIEETVEYSTNSYICPSYSDYVQFYKNRFPYKHAVKNSLAAFIAFMICSSCVLAVTIICVTMIAINANKNEMKRKKLCVLKLEKEKLELLLNEDETKVKETSENWKLVTEYYPKNKAAADIFKAYANAIAEL